MGETAWLAERFEEHGPYLLSAGGGLRDAVLAHRS
jgi:hypothetical protein